MSDKNKSVLIVGAGLGGLFSGALLAKHGIPVTVVEQHHIPGGYATSFDRMGGKYTFDVSLHWTSINDDLFRLIKELGVLEKIELVKIPDPIHLITPTDEIIISNNTEKKVKYLLETYPHEKKGILNYFSELKSLADELEKLMRDKNRPDFPKHYPKLWSIKDKTLASYIEDFIKDHELKELLCADWGSYGLPSSRLSAFYYLTGTSSMGKGKYYIKNRSQDLSDALAEKIKEFGGRVIYKTKIEKIIINNNTVSGVLTDKGEKIPAEIIVSNASAITTLNNMLPANTVPQEYLNKINDFHPSLSTFIIWLGLKTDLSKEIKECRITISSGKGTEADYISCLNGIVEDLPVTISIYDNYFEGYSKPGTSIVTIVTMSGYKPWAKYESDYKAGNKSEYRKEKNRWTEILMKKVEEKAILGLYSMAEVVESASPLTNWRYTLNDDGAVYGFEQSPGNSFLNRLDNRIPVKGLYFASAWGNPGGGYTGALGSGERTFKHIMDDLF